ncbi:MAG: serine hydrolase [Nitrososphaerales archaeon]
MRKVFRVLLILVLVFAALLSLPYLRYRRTAGIVPAWVRIGGLEVHGATENEAMGSLMRGLSEPLEVWHDDERLVLRPEKVGFQVDVSAMLKEAQAQDQPGKLVRYLVENSLERPPQTVDVPLKYRYDEAALDAWLDEAVKNHDRPPGAPVPVLETLTLAPGKAGLETNRAEAKKILVAGLAKPGNRSVKLPTRVTPPQPIDVKALGTLLQARLDQFPGIGSVWLHYLPTGEEVAINADVAYAGTSTLKIAILEQVYRKLDQPPGIETSKIISETMMHSGNFTANLMLGIVGDGDWDRGVAEMNRQFKALGMKNTFMATPYDRKLAVAPHIVTEANQRKDINTQPDAYMQTTPRDIGSSLEMLVSCSQGGGTLIALYDTRITSEECQQALDFMSLNEMKEMLVGGLPPQAKAVHKHGYVPDTHGDVAAIWGPAGPYVLAVFLYRPTWLEWAYSNPTFGDLARASWNVFQQMADEKAAQPETQPDS